MNSYYQKQLIRIKQADDEGLKEYLTLSIEELFRVLDIFMEKSGLPFVPWQSSRDISDFDPKLDREFKGKLDSYHNELINQNKLPSSAFKFDEYVSQATQLLDLYYSENLFQDIVTDTAVNFELLIERFNPLNVDSSLFAVLSVYGKALYLNKNYHEAYDMYKILLKDVIIARKKKIQPFQGRYNDNLFTAYEALLYLVKCSHFLEKLETPSYFELLFQVTKIDNKNFNEDQKRILPLKLHSMLFTYYCLIQKNKTSLEIDEVFKYTEAMMDEYKEPEAQYNQTEGWSDERASKLIHDDAKTYQSSYHNEPIDFDFYALFILLIDFEKLEEKEINSKEIKATINEVMITFKNRWRRWYNY